MTSEPERSWRALVGSESPPESPTAHADLVERLRGATCATPNEVWRFGGLLSEAADEIERLREELADAQQDIFHLKKYLASTELALDAAHEAT